MNRELKAKATESERNADDKQWFKDFINRYSNFSYSSGGLFYAINDGGFTDYHRMRVNYDLYNNILHKDDFMYVIKPFGDSKELGEMPADFTNKDIISSKIKALLSMERDRPFDWHVLAVNPEASSRREAKRSEMLIQKVVEDIMKPIEDMINAEVEAQIKALEAEAMQQQQQQQQQLPAEQEQVLNEEAPAPEEGEEGQAVGSGVGQDQGVPQGEVSQQGQGEEQPEAVAPVPSPEQIQQAGPPQLSPEAQQELEQKKQQIMQEAQQKIEQSKPEEIDRYMQRKFRDPAEILCHQLLEYIIRKQDVFEKFNLGFKNGLISGRTIFWCGILNGEPTLEVVNPLGFNFDRSNHLNRIEDGEWASYERYMTPTEIVKYFGDELSDEDIDKIYDSYSSAPTQIFNENDVQTNGVRVLHCEWKGLKKIKFVSGIDPETQEEYYIMVDEKYKINKDVGDKDVESVWIPTKFEGYKIGNDVYCYLREVPGQHKDINNLYECKLSYIGNSYDATNSATTSLVDRMKHFQYLYNIIWYRIELLTAKDDVKKILIGSNVISSSSELEVKKWMHYFKTMNIGIVNMNEEGNKGMPVNISAYVSQIDMSMSNDMHRYIQLAQYIEQMCGEAIGITRQDIAQADQIKVQTQKPFNSSILDAYFNVHRDIKKRVLQTLIEVMKVAYSTFQPESLSYFLDDVSIAQLNPDYELFDNNTYGIFVSDSPKIDDRITQIQMLAQASLQAQKIELSDVLAIMNSKNLEEAKEILMTSEDKKKKEMEAMQQQQQEMEQQRMQMQQQMQQQMMDWKMQFMIKQEELKKDRELQKQAILSTGFNEDKDMDKDGVPDVVELYKTGKNIDIKEKSLSLKEKALDLKRDELKQKAEDKKADREVKKSILKKHVK